MTLLRPLWVQAETGDTEIEYSAQLYRQILGIGLWGSRGVIPGSTDTALKISQRSAGANMSVDIAAGEAVIVGEDVSDQGAYMVRSTAVENRAIPAAPGSGTRVHRVIARVKDKLHNGTFSVYELALEVLEDTGTGTPATPDTAISLATVSVTAGQASVENQHITDTRAAAKLKADPIASHTWTNYTPTWKNGTNTPTLGTGGSINGRYQVVGTTVHYVITILLGSNFELGPVGTEGEFTVSLPFQAASVGVGHRWMGHLQAFDGNVFILIGQAAVHEGSSVIENWFFTDGSADGDVDVARPGTPVSWEGTPWQFRFAGWYEKA